MNTAELLIEAYSRVPDEVERVLDGLTAEELLRRPDAEANSIAWLVWHLARGQDSQVSAVAGTEQSWVSDGWVDRFSLDLPALSTGYGHSSADVGKVRAGAEELTGYLRDVHRRTCEYLATLAEEDLDRVVDEGWEPPVTLGVRLVSVVADDLQHLGQASYVKGLVLRARETR